MSFLVLAIQYRKDGTRETRYASEPFATETTAALHADMIRATWIDPSVEIVVEEEGVKKTDSVVMYTNAPRDYDYSYVEVVDPRYARYTGRGGTHPVIRKLRIHGTTPEEVEYRRNYVGARYLSGLYSTFTQKEMDEAVEYGQIEITDNTIVPPPSPSGAVCLNCLSPADLNDVGKTCQQCNVGIVVGSGLEDHNG